MTLKEKVNAKWNLFTVFFKTFFDIREYVWLEYKYEYRKGLNNPAVKTHIQIAKVHRNATIQQLKKAFRLKEGKGESIRIIDVKIIPAKVDVI